jgi:hypothetical protein
MGQLHSTCTAPPRRVVVVLPAMQLNDGERDERGKRDIHIRTETNLPMRLEVFLGESRVAEGGRWEEFW